MLLTLHSQNGNGSLAQLNRASDYGSEGYRFESCANHSKELNRVPFFVSPKIDLTLSAVKYQPLISITKYSSLHQYIY